MKLMTSAQMRELDRRAIEERRIPSIVLMERAAEGLASAALNLLGAEDAGSRVAVLCGVGNNGGDGIAAARLLAGRCRQVRCFLVGDAEKLTPDSREMALRLAETAVKLESFSLTDLEQLRYIRRCSLVIDAVFGVGLNREIAPDSVFAATIDAMNASRGKILAVDIASGVSADTGAILGRAVRAEETVTFTFPKIGQAVGDGAVYSGKVRIWDIGIPEDLKRNLASPVQTVGPDFVQWTLPHRKVDGHKGTFGKLLVIGGAVGYTGAPYLAASAAVRTGCGLASLGVPETIWPMEAVKCTSAMPFPLPEEAGMLCPAVLPRILEKLSACDVLALGPGLGRSQGTAEVVWELLKTEKPVVLDADGINALSGHIDVLDARRDRVTVLTPHDVEFARIGGDLSHGDRVRAAREFAMAHGCVLVLKGHRTVTATPEGNVLVNTTGGSGLAKGGSGDVLTGIIASLLAQGAGAVQAAAAGVWLHGRAGDLAEQELTAYGTTLEDVIAQLPEAIREVMAEKSEP